ncbi:MAG: sulfotransferase family 2 domain-containing protein [Christensenellales bacterium]|jgi:chondroitin 4-sulfotransferase 11
MISRVKSTRAYAGIWRAVRNRPKLHISALMVREFFTALQYMRTCGAYTRRTYHISHEKQLIYLSNSKVACSSIKASIYDLGDLSDYRRVHQVANACNDFELCVPWDKYADYYKFTFVRNPFARLVSCYVNKLITDREKLGKTMQRLYFSRYLFGYLNVDKGFHNWAARVCRIPDRLADRHFVGQHYLIHDAKGRPLVEHVFRFENLAREYETIRERFALAPLPHYNKTKKGNWMDYYDLETARRVYKRYKRDIEAFGYEEVYDALIAHIKSRDLTEGA